MGQDGVGNAIDRIDRALARIEAAARRPPPPNSGDDQEISDLRDAHLTLRGRVEGALAQIDGLLAAGERG